LSRKPRRAVIVGRVREVAGGGVVNDQMSQNRPSKRAEGGGPADVARGGPDGRVPFRAFVARMSND
jgi:hypothetical protein